MSPRASKTAVRAAAALAATLVLAGPLPPAFAQDSFNQLVTPRAQPTTPTATTPANTQNTSSSTSNGGLSTLAQAGIFAGALVLIAAIGFVIMRDARRAAPIKAHEAGLPGGREVGGRSERLRRQRARAKQARRARKRNR